ncbi:MAG: toll/interleukin-1 receptor domain-containing protein, partial [Clostridia bacterium]|nr:toll/interleukin-1 receptor domain-containing protein [Clostridia bacterium]
IFKCKICGGSLDVHIGERTAVCEYCGVEQTIPSFIDIKAQEIYNIASNYLAHNEFDKAENLYAQILIDNKSDADAYWNILMCRYGVTYVKDPASGKYIPTCNRTLYAPIFNDENYKNAIKYADEKQMALFEANAKIIDDIQKGILSVSSNEKPFDIFISYKETDANGARTKDSIAAQDLYEKLTAEGYKVFFSRITLEDKIGTEYEPYIYAALASSKVMITVSSSRANLESVWVKNEWSRFLSFMGKDSGKTLVPLYFDMDKSDLPDDFAHFPSYDMKVDGFEQDLIRGIKKLTPLPVMLLEKRKKRNKILKRIGLAGAACAVIGVICAIPWFMKLPQYNAAMQLYYDKNYPKATWAFADLGSYRNSEKMKEKCELSWRKSLANVVATKYASLEGDSYYVSQQGSIEIFDSINGFDSNENKNSNLQTDVKYVSIADGGHTSVYALREDGFVSNSKENNDLPDDWKNIVQISPKFYSTSVALTKEGKMLYGNTHNSKFYSGNDDWLTDVSTWNNIVSFEYEILDTEGGIESAAIVGIKSDGSLCGVYTSSFNSASISQAVKQFSDVKSVDIDLYDGIRITALTNHGTLQKYEHDRFSEEIAENTSDIFIDFYPEDAIYKLSNRGELFGCTGHVLTEDIVKLSSDFCISRSGSI